MKITQDSVVSFHYQLREEGSSDEFESSRDGNPVACLIGHGNIIPGLERNLLEKEVGDIFSVSVAPEDAYGQRKEDASQRVPIKHLLAQGKEKGKSKLKLKPGMVAHVQTEQGARQVVIEKVGRFNVDVDTNHPLAGKQLTFDVEIIDVREASAEEVTHGHAHGVGGHQH